MKTINLALILFAAIMLFTGSARAVTVNYFGDDNNYSDSGKGDKYYSQGNDGGNYGNNNDDGNGNKGYGNNGQSYGDSSYGNNNSKNNNNDNWPGDDKDHHKSGKYSPPEYGVGWGGDGKWGGKDGGKDDYHHYFAKICDPDGGKGSWHSHDPSCDPGDPLPLPAALPMFGAALLALAGLRLKRSRQKSVSAD